MSVWRTPSGYQVEVAIRGHRMRRHFGRRRYGSMKLAYRRAQRYERALHRLAARAREQAGRTILEPGIYLYERTQWKAQKPYTDRLVQAFWLDDFDRVRSTTYSCRRHGDEGALQLARETIAERGRALQRRPGVQYEREGSATRSSAGRHTGQSR